MSTPQTKRSHRTSKVAVTVAAAVSILAGSFAGAAPAMAKPGDVVNPLAPNSYRYTGEFGVRCIPAINSGAVHKGQDMTSPDGDTIRSIANGVVTKTKNPTGGGAGYIILRHTIDGKTVHTGYFHMWKADQFVKTGQAVKKGQKIALVGNSGPSANAHLHFEVWQGAWYTGTATNPTTWMKKQGVDLKADAFAAWSSTKPSSCTYYAAKDTTMRSTASTSSSVVKTVPKGATMTAKAAMAEVNGQYMRVTSGGKTGWVHQSAVSPNKVAAAPTTTPANLTYSTTDELNIRSGASVSNAIVKTVPKGAQVVTTGKRTGDWYQVKSGTTTGWVNSHYLVRVYAVSVSKSNAVTNRATDVRASASTSGKLAGTVAKGARVQLTGRYSGAWRLAQTPVGTGWVSAAHVTDDKQQCSTKNFADNPTGTSAHSAVRWMQCTGLTVGYSDGSFGKTRNISRGEVASFLYRMAGSPSTGIPTKSPFKDMKPTTSHYKAAAWMANKGVLNGYTDGTFKPTRAITRGEMAKISYNMADVNFKASGAAAFTDVNKNTAFYTPISWMKAAKIVGGYSDGSYKPGKSITRSETAIILKNMDRHIG